MNDILARNIKKYREKLNMSQDELAKIVGYKDRSSITKIEKGTTDITQSKVVALADALHITPNELMSETQTISVDTYRTVVDNNIIPHAKNIIPMNTERVPLVGRIAAGKPILAEQNIDGYENLAGGIHADFCVEVHGDSMIGANIHNGDIVFIRQQNDVENGEIAAVLIDDSATLKRFYHDGDTVTLIAENPKYPPMVFHNGDCEKFEILGKAVALQTLIK